MSSEFGSAWLRLWAESTSDYAVFALSLHGIVATWNPGGERIQGYRSDEIVGQPLAQLYPPEGRGAGGAPGARAAAAGPGGGVVVGLGEGQ
ncbi:PAS domain-containing protein, partial [Ralstonia psammae]|uniref:PAS domain-containing protein n=1 Tax=Ralstonia psammae TaxID=3058598 RepID=UPI00292CF924